MSEPAEGQDILDHARAYLVARSGDSDYWQDAPDYMADFATQEIEAGSRRSDETRQQAYNRHCVEHPDACKYDGCKEWAYGYEAGSRRAAEQIRKDVVREFVEKSLKRWGEREATEIIEESQAIVFREMFPGEEL